MKTQLCLAACFASFLVACGSDEPPAEVPQSTSWQGQQMAPMPMPMPPAPQQTPVATQPVAPRPPPKPKSAATIAGASITDVDGASVVGEMKKAGWVELAVALSGGSVGAYESVRFDLKKGKAKGHLEILRPLKNPPPGTTSGMESPKAQKADRDKEGATYFDEPADVLVIVVVDGNPKQAKKLIDALVKAPPASANN